MTRRMILAAALAGVGLWTSIGCATTNEQAANQQAMMKEAVAMVHPTTKGKGTGTVKFTQMADGKVKVVAHIEGLNAGQKHGFHIHEGMECGEDGMKAGGHFNPDKHDHGPVSKPMRHAGDLGNLQANDKGVAHLELTVDNITIGGDKPNNIVGRTVIVHAKEDDFSQPTGNAGDRIGCGVIKMAEAK